MNGQLTPLGLTIDVVADVVCPMSFLGKRCLDRALERFDGPSRISWHPFQLNPDMPAAGMGFDRYLTDRFGGREKVAPALDRLREAGEAQGVRFAFERLQRVPNTLDAHRILQLAAQSDRQHELADRLFSAFFEHGQDIGDRSILLQIGTETGMDPKQIAETLEQSETLKIVRAREAEVRAAGIVGAPSYLVNRQLLLPGPQNTATFLAAFQRAAFPPDEDENSPPRLH